MSVIRRDFLPPELEILLKENGIDGCVVVQADQSENETIFQIINAEENDFIKGVVGWVDLQSEHVRERLQYYSQFKKLKGFRHILQGEAKRDMMLNTEFMRGIGMLNDFDFTYDILVLPDQLAFTKDFVARFPQQKFVIDHLAKPYIKDKKLEPWKTEIAEVSQYQNVYCKISGFVTEADLKGWKKDDFTAYFDVVTECFGTKRIMFGSDWPVCTAAATYGEVINILKDYFSGFTKDEQDAFFGNNAIEFYNL